jgi:hypothetical protein
MDDTTEDLEAAACIVEAYAEGESDRHVLELLANTARDIRARLTND